MSSPRNIAYRPSCEQIESKALLSAVVAWGGGNGGGNSDSMITPANIASLKLQYTQVLDNIILPAPVSASVNVTVGPNQGPQNLVFVATAGDSLYAFNTVTGQLAWQTNFLKPGEATLPMELIQTGVNGTTSTPLIDPSTNTIYLTTTESYNAGKIVHFTKTLHAVDMSDGHEQSGSPVIIADTGYKHGKPGSFFGPSVKGTGAARFKGKVRFLVPRELQRPGLSLDGNNLLIAFGSYGDLPPFHGWILAYNKTSLKRTGVFNDTPNGNDGGIWNSGAPMVTDSQGFIYAVTGNGTFDTRLNRAGFPYRGNYGDSVLKLALKPGHKGPGGTGFKVVDYFTPSDQQKLERSDGDLASSGVLILPDGMGGPAHPDLLLASGKSGTIYVLNRNHMGHFKKRFNPIVQMMPGATGGSFDTPALFNQTIYYAGVNDVAKSFTISNGILVQTGQATNTLPWPGATPVVSSDGAQNGIVWVVSGAKRLIAYDTTDLNKQLWSAPLPDYSHFAIPTITSDGHVFVGGGNDLVAFGLSQSS
jgi:outer membrane protein assembly factor BamB